MYRLINPTTLPLIKLFGGVLFGAMAIIKPTFPMLSVCFLLIFVDCISAWLLARRVRKDHPTANDGKFKSHHFGKVIETLTITCTLILLAYLIQTYVLEFDIHLHNLFGGVCCFWQLWSILENMSSYRENGLARLLQKILVDKSKRHFDIDLKETVLNHKDEIQQIKDEQQKLKDELIKQDNK